MLPSILEKKCEEKFYVYMDETNNLRRVSLNIKNKNGLNSEDTLFVLGGVLFTYKANSIRHKESFDKFFQENNVKMDGKEEYKFKELANGGNGKNVQNFKKMLNSRKLNLFFKWLHKQRGLIHYIAIELKYFIFIDIIESDALIEEINEFAKTLPSYKCIEEEVVNFHFALKDLFGKMIDFNQLALLERLYNIDFPNTEKVNIEELREIILSHIDSYIESNVITEIEEIYCESIRKIVSKTDFFFMFDYPDKPYSLIKELTFIYINRLSDFHKSKIVLDNEIDVQEDLRSFKNIELKQRIKKKHNQIYKIHYSFQDSKHNFILQISDILVGVIKEFYNFCIYSDIKINKWEEFLDEFYSNLTDCQRENIVLFMNLHVKSLELYNGIQKTTTRLEHRKKFDMLMLYIISRNKD